MKIEILKELIWAITNVVYHFLRQVSFKKYLPMSSSQALSYQLHSQGHFFEGVKNQWSKGWSCEFTINDVNWIVLKYHIIFLEIAANLIGIAFNTSKGQRANEAGMEGVMWVILLIIKLLTKFVEQLRFVLSAVTKHLTTAFGACPLAPLLLRSHATAS